VVSRDPPLPVVAVVAAAAVPASVSGAPPVASSVQSPAAPPADPDRQALAEELLDAALAACRQGDFDAVAARRPRATRWLVRRHALRLCATLGRPPADGLEPRLLRGLLDWALSRLRPDGAPPAAPVPDAAWIDAPAWRPWLALMCHARLLAVPAFPARYRRRPDESAVDNLCGLWEVGPSTFYRYVERAQRRLAALALTPPDAAACLSLRRFAVDRWGPPTDGRADWHRARAEHARRQGDAATSLWHAVQAGDPPAVIALLRARASALAGEQETDALLAPLALPGAPLSPDERIDLLLAQAALARTRQEPERELRLLEQALQAARDGGAARGLGTVYGELARFHEPRDSDRAFAAYADSLRYLAAAEPGELGVAGRAAHLTSLVRLAWMHVVRDHPRAKSMLEDAEALRRRDGATDDLVGLLEQSWGEYWRRAGDHERAVQARHRALNAFERVGDRRSVLVTYVNLVLLHGDAMETDKAREYAQRVFQAAQSTVVEPAVVVSAHGNLGVAQARVRDYPAAIESFRRALDGAVRADLRLHANRLRLNLASAHYGLFVQTRDPAQERLGDEALEAFRRAPPSETTPSFVETAKGLKAEVLGERPDRSIDQMLDDESAAHQSEMAEIQRRRAALRQASSPVQSLQDRLAIAAAYARIAAAERDAAVAWAGASGLAGQVAGEIERLGLGWAPDADRAQALAAEWRAATGDLIDDERRLALADSLLREGAISKSAYAAVCQVSPATASKHLSVLAARGLLAQTGKGPATRYRLPG
jgi:tetratricopeptide (TPR) repeat protein